MIAKERHDNIKRYADSMGLTILTKYRKGLKNIMVADIVLCDGRVRDIILSEKDSDMQAIEERAVRIAIDEYGKDIDDLPDNIQDKIRERVMEQGDGHRKSIS